MFDTSSGVTRVLGGTIRRLSDGQFVAASYFHQHQPTQFESFEDAEQWLLELMDPVMIKFYGGVVRRSPSGRIVARSHHWQGSARFDTLEDAKEWLLDQMFPAKPDLS
jgi:hypothetical protein